MKYFIICLFTVTTLFSQKEIDCGGFARIVDGKYIITYQGKHNDVQRLGVMDMEGSQILDNNIDNRSSSYSRISNFIYEDVAIGFDVEKDKNIAFDLATRKVITEGFLYYSGFTDGINLMTIPYKVSKNNRFAIDKNNKRLFDLPASSMYLGKFNNGIAVVGKDKKGSRVEREYKYIDTKGKIILDPDYSFCDDFKEDLAVVAKTVGYIKYYGFIDKKGTELIDLKFTNKPTAFSDGKSRVITQDNKYGFIDKQGAIIIEPQYQYATGFYKNRALVKTESKNWALIDEKNQVLKEYNSFYDLSKRVKDESSQQIEVIKKFVDYNLLIIDGGSFEFDKLMQMDGSYPFSDKEGWMPVDFGEDYIIISALNKDLGSYENFIVNRKGEKVFITNKNQF